MPRPRVHEGESVPRSIRVPVRLYQRMMAKAAEDERTFQYLAVKCLERCYPDTDAASQPTQTTDPKAPYPDPTPTPPERP